MPAVEEDIKRIMEKKLSLAAFLPDSKEIVGVVVLCPKEGPDLNYNVFLGSINRFITEMCTFMGKELREKAHAARGGIHAIPYPLIYPPQGAD